MLSDDIRSVGAYPPELKTSTVLMIWEIWLIHSTNTSGLSLRLLLEVSFVITSCR